MLLWGKRFNSFNTACWCTSFLKYFAYELHNKNEIFIPDRRSCLTFGRLFGKRVITYFTSFLMIPSGLIKLFFKNITTSKRVVHRGGVAIRHQARFSSFLMGIPMPSNSPIGILAMELRNEISTLHFMFSGQNSDRRSRWYHNSSRYPFRISIWKQSSPSARLDV